MAEDQSTRIAKITGWFTESRDWRAPKKRQMEQLYRLYRMYLTLDETWTWQSQIFIPEAFTVITTVLAAVMEAMLGQDPFIVVEALREDTVEGAKFAQTLLNNQLARIGSQNDNQGFYMNYMKWVLDILCFGNGHVDNIWRFIEGPSKKRIATFNEEPVPTGQIDPNTGEELIIPPGILFAGYRIEENIASLYDDPDIINLDWNDVYPDPFASTVQSPARFSIVRQTWTVEQLESVKGLPGWKNLDKIKFTANPHLDDELETDDKKLVDDVDQHVGATGGGKYVEILKCQYAKKEGKFWREYWTIIADRALEVFNEANPYHHGRRTIIKGDCYPLVNRYYSVGILEVMQDLQDGTNQRYNQMADIVTMVLNPMFKVTESLYSKLEDMYQGNIPATPGRMIPAEVNEELEPIAQLTNFNLGNVDLGFLRKHIEEASATSEATRGGQPPASQTATATITTSEKANRRFKFIVKILFYTTVRPLADMILQMDHQFKSDAEEVKLKNEQGLEQWRRIFMEDVPFDGLAFRPNMFVMNPGLDQRVRAQLVKDFALEMANTPMGQMLDWEQIGKIFFELNELPEANSRVLLSSEEIRANQAAVMADALTQLAQQGQEQGQLPASGGF